MSEVAKTTVAEKTAVPNTTQTAPSAEGTAPEQKTPESTPKLFTQEELDTIISRRFAKLQQDSEKKIADAVTEAQKLAKMNAEERAEHERQKLEETMNRREAEITRRELRAQALETMAERGMPKELADILPYTDAQTTSDAINAVERVFRAAVEKAVTDKLRGNAPKTNAGPQGTESTYNDEIKKQLYGGK